MSEPPPSLPPEFHEDWQRSFDFVSIPNPRLRVVLEALAAETVNHNVLRKYASRKVTSLRETEATLARRDKLLRECLNRLAPNRDVPGREYSDLVRRILAELGADRQLEGTK